MILPLQDFSTLVENMAAGLQGSAAQLVDLSVGSVLRALLESCASIAMWMQWLILQVLSMTRASTSNGADLDSWMADFSLTRLSGTASVGAVSFSRYTTGVDTLVPVGSLVKTSDGSLTFAVTADGTNPAWNGSSGYVLPAAISSVTLPVKATSPGAAGNVLTGAITLSGSAISGVDVVYNAQPLVGGADAESDTDLRSRFQLYINSRSLATRGAVGSAIRALQLGLRYAVLENVDLGGNDAPGNFCVVVDDGSGTASDNLIATVSAAVDAVRPLGSTFSVTRPIQMPVSISLAVVTFPGSDTDAITAEVENGVITWISALPMGGILAVSKLEAIAHDADSSVASVSVALINGSSSGIQASEGTVIILAGLTVAVS